jgi:hypothetical protein
MVTVGSIQYTQVSTHRSQGPGRSTVGKGIFTTIVCLHGGFALSHNGSQQVSHMMPRVTFDGRAHPDPVKAETTEAVRHNQPQRTAATRSFGERGLRRGPEEGAKKGVRINDWQQHRWRCRARA